MGPNFDDYPGLQQKSSVRNNLLQSVLTKSMYLEVVWCLKVAKSQLILLSKYIEYMIMNM